MFSKSMTCHHHQFHQFGTIMVMPSPSGGNLQIPTYFSTYGVDALLSNRCGINSILIGSLLTLLIKGSAEGGDSDYISQVIFVDTSSIFGDVKVATTPMFLNLEVSYRHQSFCIKGFWATFLHWILRRGPLQPPTCHYYHNRTPYPN